MRTLEIIFDSKVVSVIPDTVRAKLTEQLLATYGKPPDGAKVRVRMVSFQLSASSPKCLNVAATATRVTTDMDDLLTFHAIIPIPHSDQPASTQAFIQNVMTMTQRTVKIAEPLADDFDQLALCVRCNHPVNISSCKFYLDCPKCGTLGVIGI